MIENAARDISVPKWCQSSVFACSTGCSLLPEENRDLRKRTKNVSLEDFKANKITYECRQTRGGVGLSGIEHMTLRATRRAWNRGRRRLSRWKRALPSARWKLLDSRIWRAETPSICPATQPRIAERLDHRCRRQVTE